MFESPQAHEHDHSFADEEYDELDLERETYEADHLDPLDAQSLGHRLIATTNSATKRFI